MDVCHSRGYLVCLRLLRVIHTGILFKADFGVPVRGGVERCGAGRRRGLVISRGFGYGQHLGPVILEEVGITAQVFLHGYVESLCLTVTRRGQGGYIAG